VVARRRPRPQGVLPAGTTVTTPIGSFEVKPRAFRGSLLKVGKPPVVNPAVKK
jgi:hypothetical protein